MSSIDKAALLIGRLFAVLGAGLLLLALTWPWITLRMDSPGLPEELRLSLSGGDVVALGAAYAAMTPNLDNLLGQMSQIEPQLSTDRTFRQIKRQIEAGVSIVNDGEQSKPSYATYIKHRLSGFGGEAG